MALRLENFHSFIPPSENHLDLGRKSQQPGLGRARKGCARNENAIEIHAAWGKPLGKTNNKILEAICSPNLWRPGGFGNLFEFWVLHGATHWPLLALNLQLIKTRTLFSN
jgi:hypothetical protein